MSIVFAGLLFGGISHVEAKSFDSASFERRINVIVNLMNLMTQFPEFENRIKPIVSEHLEQLFADLANEEKTRGTEAVKNKKEKNTPAKEYKKAKKQDNYEQKKYAFEDITELEAEPYENIEGKWQVDIEFNDEKKRRVYVYNIDDTNELMSNIADKIDVEFGIDISNDEVAEILEFDEDTL